MYYYIMSLIVLPRQSLVPFEQACTGDIAIHDKLMQYHSCAADAAEMQPSRKKSKKQKKKQLRQQQAQMAAAGYDSSDEEQTDSAASHAAPQNGLQDDEAHASQDFEDEVLERMMASVNMGQPAAREGSPQVGTRLDWYSIA